jgi:DNA-binding CsgD family transcriptional regulator
VNRGYLIQDATIVHGQKVQGHFTWAELEALYPEDPVFEAARGHGLKHGNTLSLHVNGSITIVSCSGPKWNEEQLVKARSAAAALHFWNLPEPEFPVIVSEGVLETLRLMAAGLRDQEIAIELGVKIETIRQRRNLAYQRTGTKTPAHLVSFVIKNGWI